MENFLKPWFIDNIYFAKKLWVKFNFIKIQFSQTSYFNRISIKIRIFAKKLQNLGPELTSIPLKPYGYKVSVF